MANPKISFFKKNFLIICIFILAVILRFVYFGESVYFGWDEARDAYISQQIYLLKDLKMIGPPANFPGLFHGPLYWYILGLLYLLGSGDVFFVSGVFRIINALGVILIFLVGKKFFNSKVGIIAAILYAASFEQSQYAIYFGHPALTIPAWLSFFLGTAMVFKDRNYKGLILMFVSAALAVQLELVTSHILILLVIFLFLLRDKLKKAGLKIWIVGLGLFLLILSSYIVSEVKYDFQSTKAVIAILKEGYSVMQPGETKFGLYAKMFLRLINDNLISFLPPKFLSIFSLAFILLLVKYTFKFNSLVFILFWILGGIFIIPLVSYDAYYLNVGIGLGVIVGFAFILERIWGKSKFLGVLLILVVLSSNFFLILKQNKNSLITEIKAQPFMKLTDELDILDLMYQHADGKGFTVRATSMPFKIQTVWAYLFNYYGYKKWSYLPYWEGEMVAGYPGFLPRPKEGTSCIRYLIREPVRGIPLALILQNEKEEDFFSKIEEKKEIGRFELQIRRAHGKCHDIKP